MDEHINPNSTEAALVESNIEERHDRIKELEQKLETLTKQNAEQQKIIEYNYYYSNANWLVFFKEGFRVLGQAFKNFFTKGPSRPNGNAL